HMLPTLLPLPLRPGLPLRRLPLLRRLLLVGRLLVLPLLVLRRLLVLLRRHLLLVLLLPRLRVLPLRVPLLRIPPRRVVPRLPLLLSLLLSLLGRRLLLCGLRSLGRLLRRIAPDLLLPGHPLLRLHATQVLERILGLLPLGPRRLVPPVPTLRILRPRLP